MTRFLFLSILTATAAWSQTRAPLDSLLNLALSQNPQLHSLRHRAVAAHARVGQVSTLDAPQIGVEFYQTPVSSFPLPHRRNMEMDYFVQQMFPWPGKLSAMGKAASLSAEMQDEEAAAFERQLIRDLKSTYFDLYFVQRQLDINDENRRLLKQILEAAMKRYEVGLGNQSDILRIKTEQSKTVNERLELEKQEVAMETMIQTLIGGDPDRPLGRLPDPGVEAQEWEYEHLVTIALDRRPELKSMQFNRAMFAAEVDAARREYYPDIMVRGMYKAMAEGGDFWALMIGANIPLAFWSKEKYQSRVREMSSHVNHADMELINMRNMVAASVKSALTTQRASRQQVKLYREELLPQAEQTLEITLSDYQTGRTSFIALLDNYRMLLMTRLDHEMAVMNALKSEADLERAVGADLQGLNDSMK
jgi:outer membrane protein TolC